MKKLSFFTAFYLFMICIFYPITLYSQQSVAMNEFSKNLVPDFSITLSEFYYTPGEKIT